MSLELMKTYHTLDKFKQRILQISALIYDISGTGYSYYSSNIASLHREAHKHLMNLLALDNKGTQFSEKQFS